ncbi:hypothetical protein K501DRAFT_338719 [Backusella circina FSU 941]|nr:hypothetical protein K501DRAFT_338719 [Backusella circina FSU 941]
MYYYYYFKPIGEVPPIKPLETFYLLKEVYHKSTRRAPQDKHLTIIVHILDNKGEGCFTQIMLFVQDDTFNNNNKIDNVPDYFPPNVCHDIIPEEENNNNNIKNFRAAKDYHEDQEDEDFYFLGQHLNTPGLLDDEYPDYYDSNFEIANRAFYATINKFTRQSCPESSRRKTSYSFLENWHLHSIYSKSQQTLLGISPVRPSVLLSGDDFMFTPPFVSPENSDQLEFDWEESDDSEFYSLSPCPESNQAGQFVPLSSSSSNNDMQTSLILSAPLPPTPPSDATVACLTEKGGDKIANCYNSFNESSLLNENNWIENQRRPRSLSGFDVNESMSANSNLISDNVHHITLQDANNNNHAIDMSEDIFTSYMSNDPHFPSSSSSSSSSEGENEIEEEEYDDDEEEYDDDEEEYDDDEEAYDDDFKYIDQAYDDGDDDDDDDYIDYSKRRSGELSTFNFEHLYEQKSTENEIVIYKELEEASMTRSSSFLSHKSAEIPHMTPSIMSYQSLADILSSPPLSPPSPSLSLSVKNYGTIEQQNDNNMNSHTLPFEPIIYSRGMVQVVKSTVSAIFDLSNAYASHYDEEMAITSVQGVSSPESGGSANNNSFWAYSFVYIMYIWQLLVLCAESVIVNIRKHIIPHRQ